MKHGLFAFLLLGASQYFPAAALAQAPTFSGQVKGSFEPAADGATFTAAGGYANGDQPFLLGTVDFSSGGSATAYVFTAGLEVTAANGTPLMAFFNTPVPATADTLTVAGLPSDDAVIDGKAYHLDLLGVTATGVFDHPTKALTATGDDSTTGYLWAKVSESPTPGGEPVYTATGGHTMHNHCHETPEPSAWLLAAGAVVGGLGWNWNRRRKLAL